MEKKEFVPYDTVRDNALKLGWTIVQSGFIPDVIYVSLRGGAYLGNILSDLASRRGMIERQESIGGFLFEVEAHVPLAKLFDYADKVRSLSQGRAASAMEPYSYEPAPDDVVKQLLGE